MITTKKRKQIFSSLNTNHIFSFKISIFLLISLVVSCSGSSLFYPDDPFLLCKAGDFSCEYEYNTPGFVTVTQGSRRRHFILTRNGLRGSKIKEGEPVAYNPANKLAAVEERTDSSIEVSIIDTESGETVSSSIEFPIFEHEHKEENEAFGTLTYPSIESACITDNGTLVILVDYDQPPMNSYSEHYDFIFVFEKGNAGNIKKYVFPDSWSLKGDTLTGKNSYQTDFEESPIKIQCGRNGEIYLLTAKLWGNSYTRNAFPPVYNLDGIDLNPQKGKANITNIALIAFDKMHSFHYFEKTKSIYSFLKGEDDENAVLRRLDLGEYEITDKPIEREDGRFLFSETPDGKPLVFFVKTRKNIEEQRLELLDL